MSGSEVIGGHRDVALVDLVDRLMAGGVVIGGDLILSVADVDLVQISLRAIIASVGSLESPLSMPPAPQAGDRP
jgi:hypothetical protein